MKQKIAQRIRLFRDEGCWLDEDALRQGFICPDEPKCEDCVSQYGVLTLISEEIEKVDPLGSYGAYSHIYCNGFQECQQKILSLLKE